jgi:hypothetical protein
MMACVSAAYGAALDSSVLRRSLVDNWPFSDSEAEWTPERPITVALAHSPIRVASTRQDRQEPLPVKPQQLAVRLAIVNKVDDVIEEPRQNQLRIGIADTDA